MAFNPFDSFRKHKRAFFAVLAVICMFTFVLTSGIGGGGGALDALMRMVGAGTTRSREVIELNDDTVYESDLAKVAHQRLIANQVTHFAFGSRLSALSQTAANARKANPKGDDPKSQLYQSAQQYLGLIAQGTPQSRWMLSIQPQLQQNLQRAWFQEKDPAVKNYLQETFHVSAFFHWRALAKQAQGAKGDDPVWFFGSGRSDEDIVEFLSWKALADQMGIELTNADVRDIFNNVVSPTTATLTGDEVAEEKLIAGWFENRESVTRDEAYEALQQEFRVALAKLVVMGDRPKIVELETRPPFEGSSPDYRAYEVTATFRTESPHLFPSIGPATPSDLLKSYRKERTYSNVAMLSLPVTQKQFMDVKTEPTKEELQELFQQGRDISPRLDSSLPAFRIPRRIQIEWISDFPVPENAPPYRGISQVFPLTGTFWTFHNPEAKVFMDRAHQMIVGMIASRDPWLQGALAYKAAKAYTELKDDRQMRSRDSTKEPLAAPKLIHGDASLALKTYSINTPTTAASLIGYCANVGLLDGLTARGGATFNAVANPLVRYKYEANLKSPVPFPLQEPIEAEKRHRSRFLAGAGAFFGPSTFTGLGDFGRWGRLHQWNKEANEDQTIPIGVTRIQLMKKLEQDLAKELRDSNIARFREELKTVPEQAADMKDELDEVLEQVQTGLELLVGDELDSVSPTVDQLERALTDQLLAKYRLNRFHGRTTQLRSEQDLEESPGLEALKMAIRPGAGPGQFGQHVFSDPREGLFSAAPYEAKAVAGTGGVRFWYWKTESAQSETPTYAQVKDQVLQTWKLEQARKAAEKKAREIRDELNKQSGDAEIILNKAVTELDLPPLSLTEDLVVGHEVPTPSTLGGSTSRSYVPFRLSEYLIKYPTDNFVEEVLKVDARKAVVVTDLPKKHYYVIYVRAKQIPNAKEVAQKRTQSPELPLWSQISDEQRDALIKLMRDQLRRQSGPVNADGEFALKVKTEDNN